MQGIAIAQAARMILVGSCTCCTSSRKAFGQQACGTWGELSYSGESGMRAGHNLHLCADTTAIAAHLRSGAL